MGDIAGFIGGIIVVFIAGALAFWAIRGALRGLTAASMRAYWFYFPLAVIFTVISIRTAMFCMDLVTIYCSSTFVVFD